VAVQVLTDRPEYRLVRLVSGGFVLDPEGDPVSAAPAEGGFDFDGASVTGWRVRPDGAGLLLSRAAGDEAGRSLRPGAEAAPDDPISMLLDDGRLYRMVLRGPRDARFDLVGWETDGAYFEARPSGEGWAIRATVAGTGMEDADGLLLLFAAELHRHDAGAVATAR
jgi:hypothetical protein